MVETPAPPPRFLRIHQLWDAAETAQFHIAGRAVRQDFCYHRQCVVKIQAMSAAGARRYEFYRVTVGNGARR